MEATQTPAEGAPTIGNYSVLAELNQGDIADLFLAQSLGAGGFEKLVLIKRLHPHLVEDDEISRLFMSEARSASLIEHPNVRMVYEIGSADDMYFIALEYLEGVPFLEFLKARRREPKLNDPRMMVSLLAQVGRGLHAAHSVSEIEGGIIHGDLNPRSIFVTATGFAKILDFDIVEMRSALSRRHGFVRQTSAYISPEQIRSGSSDHRGDVFALGVVGWEALTGRRLFKKKTVEKTRAAIDRGRIPTVKDFRPDISDELNAVIMRALNRDPTLRYQSAQDFASALERAGDVEGPPVTPVGIADALWNAFEESVSAQQRFVQRERNRRLSDQQRTALIRRLRGEGGPKGTSEQDWEQPTNVATKVQHRAFAQATKTAPRSFDGTVSEESRVTEVANEILRDTAGDDPFLASLGIGNDDPFDEASVDLLGFQGLSPVGQDTKSFVLAPPSVDATGEHLEVDPDASGVVDLDGDSFDEALGLHETTSERLPSLREPVEPPLKPRPEETTPTPDFSTRTPPEQPLALAARKTPASAESESQLSLRADPPRRDVPPLPSAPTPKPVRIETVQPDLASAAAMDKGRSRKTFINVFVGALALVALGLGLLLMLKGDKPKDSPAPAALADNAPALAPASFNEPGAEEGAGAAAARQDIPPDLGGPEVSEDETGEDETSTGADESASAQELEGDEGGDEGDGKIRPDQADSAPEPIEAAPKKVEPAPKKIESTPKKSPRNKGKKVATPPKKTVKRAAKAAPKTKGPPGFLTVSAKPYATVFVDGKKKGITPLVKLSLSPGAHRVKLVSSQGGKSKMLSVRIKSNSEVRRKVEF